MTRRSTRLAAANNPDSASSIASADETESEIAIPWFKEDDKIPIMIPPESSSDLLIESEILFPAMEIYETCIAYYRIIQVSPFLFEDFCCALRSPEQTRLLAELHIAFTRLFFRDDDDAQSTFCSQDTNNCFNVMHQLLDGMTYAEILRNYLESDPRFECDHIVEILVQNYPFVEVDKRITVLKWLCDFFLETYSFRQLISNEGLMTYDDVCRFCGKPGDVLLCDGCEACYHLECTDLEAIPAGQWFCQVCKLHCLRNTIDVKDLADSMAKHKYRNSALGYDRHGRMYWFVVKRVFIHDLKNGNVYYYSTLPQLYNLIKQLDPIYYEKELCNNLLQSLDEIARQMKITLELTKKFRETLIQKIGNSRETPLSYLDVDNSFHMASILGENFAENVKMEVDEDVSESFLAQICELLNIKNGRLVDSFWSGGLNEQQLIDLQNSLIEEVKLENGNSSLVKSKIDNMQRGYRLAFSDGHYRDYQNEYSTNELAKSYKQRSKERDRKKYLSARFALVDEGEFLWTVPKGRDYYSAEGNVCKIIQMSIRKLVEKLPDELLHRLWKDEKQQFLERLNSSTTVSGIRYLLLQLERAIRKPVFSNIWWNSLGLTKLMRVTSDDREERSKLDAIRKKEDRALQTADPHIDSDVLFVKYLKARPSSLSLWRLRDEAFRLNNRYQMGGWLWISATLVRNFQKPVGPAPLGIDYFNVKSDSSPAVKKALRLYNLIKKLAAWRTFFERREGAFSGHLMCYSPSCFYSPLGFNPSLKCYNPNCPRTQCEIDTAFKSKAYKNGVRPSSKIIPNKAPMLRKSVKGEGAPFPFPKPLNFFAKSAKKRSLLILPQPILRRLARQGGLNAAQPIPGFNKQAKTNTSVWLYPCPRPLFDNCWRYSTLNATTFHAIALSLRIMHSCIRWADMEPSDESETRVITHFPDHDERRFIISHKENAPDGYYEQYKIKVQILSIDDDANSEDGSVSYRSGGGSVPRSRKRKSTKSRQSLMNSANRRVTDTTERWMDGVDLKLHEIVSYWSRFNKAVTATRMQQNPTTPMPQPRTFNSNSATMTSAQAYNTPMNSVRNYTPMTSVQNFTPVNRLTPLSRTPMIFRPKSTAQPGNYRRI